MANVFADFFFAVGLLAIPWLRKYQSLLKTPDRTDKFQFLPNTPPWLSEPAPLPSPQPPTGSSPSSSSKSHPYPSRASAGRLTSTSVSSTPSSFPSSTSFTPRPDFYPSNRSTSYLLVQRCCFIGITAWVFLERLLRRALVVRRVRLCMTRSLRRRYICVSRLGE